MEKEEWDEKRIDIIGQNGNDGIHYDLEEQKPLEVYGEKSSVQKNIDILEERKKTKSSSGKRKLDKQITKLKSKLDSSDQITYF